MFRLSFALAATALAISPAVAQVGGVGGGSAGAIGGSSLGSPSSSGSLGASGSGSLSGGLRSPDAVGSPLPGAAPTVSGGPLGVIRPSEAVGDRIGNGVSLRSQGTTGLIDSPGTSITDRGRPTGEPLGNSGSTTSQSAPSGSDPE